MNALLQVVQSGDRDALIDGLRAIVPEFSNAPEKTSVPVAPPGERGTAVPLFVSEHN